MARPPFLMVLLARTAHFKNIFLRDRGILSCSAESQKFGGGRKGHAKLLKEACSRILELMGTKKFDVSEGTAKKHLFHGYFKRGALIPGELLKISRKHKNGSKEAGFGTITGKGPD